MKKLKKIGALRNAFQHIRRSPFQSLAAVGIMFLTFFAATILAALVFSLSSALKFLETRPEAIAFLKDGLNLPQVQQLQQKITVLDGIKEVKFVSKEEALKIYREQNKDNPLLLEMVSANILPASLEISAINPQYLLAAAELLKKETSLVEEIVFPQDVVEKVSFWVKAVKLGGLVVLGLLSFVGFTVVTVVIGMRINHHREEINVLRSLGATGGFIQAPFLVEGIIYGLLGSIFGFLSVFGLVWFFSEDLKKFENFFAPVAIIPNNNLVLLVLGVEVLIGVSFGFFASYLVSRRGLKK